MGGPSGTRLFLKDQPQWQSREDDIGTTRTIATMHALRLVPHTAAIGRKSNSGIRNSPRAVLILDEKVVSRTAVQHVNSRAADQHVVAGSSQQSVNPGTAHKNISALSAVGREPNDPGGQARRAHGIISAERIDGEVVGRFAAGNCYRS